MRLNCTEISCNRPYADHILIPRAQPEVVHFLVSNESPYFSSCKSKISASNSLQFWRYDKKCEVSWYTRYNFLWVFIIASSPWVHTFFCLWRVNKKLPQDETSQNAFSEVKVNQLKVKNIHVKMGISTKIQLINKILFYKWYKLDWEESVYISFRFDRFQRFM